MSYLNQFLTDESGQAMAEYGLVIALVASGVIGALTAFKEAREDLFSYVLDKLSEALGFGD